MWALSLVTTRMPHNVSHVDPTYAGSSLDGVLEIKVPHRYGPDGSARHDKKILESKEVPMANDSYMMQVYYDVVTAVQGSQSRHHNLSDTYVLCNWFIPRCNPPKVAIP